MENYHHKKFSIIYALNSPKYISLFFIFIFLLYSYNYNYYNIRNNFKMPRRNEHYDYLFKYIIVGDMG